MRNNGTFWQGYKAAKAGQPSSASPPKPDKLPRGESYPGDWCNWLSGWCHASEGMGNDTLQERGELYRMTIEGLK